MAAIADALEALDPLGVARAHTACEPVVRRQRDPRWRLMEHEHEELTAEVRELRALNQRVRTDLARLEDPRQAIRHAISLLIRRALRRVRGVGSRLIRPLRRRGEDDYHHDFRPYRARCHELPAHERPRVLHAIANFTTGGSARLIVDLVERLGGEYEQRVVVRAHPLVPGYEGVTIDDYPHLTSARPLRRLLARFSPDIVHVHFVADQTSRWSDLDYEWYIHVFDAAAGTQARVVQNVNVPTEPFRHPEVDRYVYVSEYVKKRYALPGDLASVIHPGTDLAYFQRPAGVGHPHTTVGLAYRLQGDKLDERAVDPLIEVLRRRPAASAIVVGGGEHLAAYKAAASRAGVAERMMFPGYVAFADLARWYAEMTVVVAPVHTESFGQASVFAMGMELPVAGYRVGALEEVLGDAELLAPPGDVAALADRIVELLDDPDRRKAIGLKNRRRAEERFSVEGMADRYRALYGEMTSSTADGLVAPGRARAGEST